MIVGKGGDGADTVGLGESGGAAIELNDDARINNNGIIGGGGGGGGNDTDGDAKAAGGGGAGFTNGAAGGGTTTGPTPPIQIGQPQQGTNTTGGNGGVASVVISGELFTANSGSGGDLG